MKKILLIGDYKDNGGPTNVNRELINNSNNLINCINSDNKYLKIMETLFKIFFSKTIVISGYSTKSILYSNYSHFLGKKVIYLMHGCIKYENSINNLNLSEKYVNSEIKFLCNVDKILCVSELYSKWVSDFYLSVKDKISFLNNGIPKIDFNNIPKKKLFRSEYVISLIGGNRNIKNNLIVCKAVDELIKDGYKIKLKLFGRTYPDNENINITNVNNYGMVSKEKLNEELKDSNLYINNSHVEPFGLSVIDALVAGCDLVINKNVGAASIFKIDSKYIIKDENDIGEIKEKILYVMSNSNNNEIINTILNECDYENTSEKLITICNNL